MMFDRGGEHAGANDFLASSWAQEIRSDAAMHAERLFDFQLTHGSGEPLKWGATAVNMIMGDLYPRKVLAVCHFRARVPSTSTSMSSPVSSRVLIASSVGARCWRK